MAVRAGLSLIHLILKFLCTSRLNSNFSTNYRSKCENIVSRENTWFYRLRPLNTIRSSTKAITRILLIFCRAISVSHTLSLFSLKNHSGGIYSEIYKTTNPKSRKKYCQIWLSKMVVYFGINSQVCLSIPHPPIYYAHSGHYGTRDDIA